MAISYDPKMVQWMRKSARRYGVDFQSVLSVALTEGGLQSGAVGDGGTSFGPFQLHRGGALPTGRGEAWANSRQGIDYAIRKMAESGAKGLTGAAARESIIRNFERPFDPDRSIARASEFASQIAAGALGKGVKVSGKGKGDGGGLVLAGQGFPVVGGAVNNNIVAGLLAASTEFARTGNFKTDVVMQALMAKAQENDSVVKVRNKKGRGSTTVPASTVGDPEKSLRHVMKVARDRFGLRVGENSLYDHVDRVHTETSNHYQTFDGSNNYNKSIGRAADISGDPTAMMAFTKWAHANYRGQTRELFHDPWGGTKANKSVGAIGGHDKHVHIAF
jgi:hypothetical protein